ncbi:hypothetical protein AMATHDRAFT_2868 [Amanita thiersii Skay4041]|uniref:Pyridoxamine 5'-phosphate oxidase N-terminal domain-containing protein n=1 Tax=Amanita thiersii Skay4041 TaxID=703135 RepID=A0A2A9NM19_9AGAR|nr:hypothetical protein AMATHDRAFT_2868 [Amanita thiersii Skay4041]
MGKLYDEIPEELVPWMRAQKVFFVATAPLAAGGHVNLSPKGNYGQERQVWYEDLSGSGVETIAHLRENGRITIMFTAFEGAPRIVRLFGRGSVHEYGSTAYERLVGEASKRQRQPGSRAVIMVDVYQVGTSCGWSVPLYSFERHRSGLNRWAAKRENADEKAETAGEWCAEKGMKEYWISHNRSSLDGIPAMKLRRPEEWGGTSTVLVVLVVGLAVAGAAWTVWVSA